MDDPETRFREATRRIGSLFWISQALSVAFDLGILNALADGAATTESLAARCALQSRGVQSTLRALNVVGVVTHSGDAWQLTELGTYIVANGNSLSSEIVLPVGYWQVASSLGERVRGDVLEPFRSSTPSTRRSMTDSPARWICKRNSPRRVLMTCSISRQFIIFSTLGVDWGRFRWLFARRTTVFAQRFWTGPKWCVERRPAVRYPTRSQRVSRCKERIFSNVQPSALTMQFCYHAYCTIGGTKMPHGFYQPSRPLWRQAVSSLYMRRCCVAM